MATLDRENTAESRTGNDTRQSTATEDDTAKQNDEQASETAAQDETEQAGAKHTGGAGVPDAPEDADFAVKGVGPAYVLSEDELNLDEDDEDDEDDVAPSGDLYECAIASGDAPPREPGASSDAGYGSNSDTSVGGQGRA